MFREYAGGYSDMLSQRGRGVEARDKGAPASKAKAGEPKPEAGKGAAAASAKRRLSFHEQHALKTLPKTMDDLRAKLEKLAAEIADPALYARDPARFDKASAALAETQAALDAAEEEWLRLEILKEELEG